MRPVRKRNNFGGISTVIVMALVIAVSIAIAVYFISYFLGLSSSVIGTAQATVTPVTFSAGAFDLSIKNTGTVGITNITVHIIDINTHQMVVNITCGKGFPTIAGGASASLSCLSGSSVCTIAGKAVCYVNKNSQNTNGVKWPDDLQVGTTYRIVVVITYSNGKTQVIDLGKYTLT